MRAGLSAKVGLQLLLALAGCTPAGQGPAATQGEAAPPSSVAAAPEAAPEPAPEAPPTIAAAEEDHEAGWQAFLEAMRSGDLERVRARTTESGYATLMRGVNDGDPAETFQRWGEGWLSFGIRWQSASANEAYGKMGPEVKAHGIWLVREGGVWKLERWAPGS
ncbi:MAG: hypothetical protein H6711_32865 [Myxococcales bacterium]|nr:hypothetical protein [Myxococcales bacterium]